MNSEREKTPRGFALIEMVDLYGKKFSIQKSSLGTEDAIWLGIDDPEPVILASEIIDGGTGWAKYPLPAGVEINTRMHLSREQVAGLLTILQKFVETGEV